VPYHLLQDVEFREGVVVQSFTNLCGCRIGDETRIGPFVEIQRGGVGARCKVQSHAFVCESVELGNEVFVGHGVAFVNDKFRRAATDDGALQGSEHWQLQRTVVKSCASIGSGAGALDGLQIDEGALVGAGAVVTHDAEAGTVVAGNPSRPLSTASE
jgi:acetyltransferase-like isoleucine patch superfamily enzyme